ncbi:Exocyst complex component Exo70 [Sesbania bispinosa]|nr:Exocyst complex component Exo70 [Sesbania bispinosa]
MQPKVWRFLGFASAVVGLLCYALSSSFNHLFGNWNLLKIVLYSVFSFVISLMVLFAKVWQHSRSLRFKAHLAFLVLTITAVYSFFSDKVMNGKPDAYSLISCAAFAIMTLSLSRQTQCFSYSLIILRSYFSPIDAALQNEYDGLRDEDFVAIEVYSPQLATSSTDIASMMQQLATCVKALQQENSNLINMVLGVLEWVEFRSEIVVTDHNFVIDALPSGRIDELHEIAKLMMGAGFEKEFSEVYSSWRREWLEECVINKLLGLQKINIKKEQDRAVFIDYTMIERWITTSKVSLKILFPGERRLCDHVFLGFSPAADRCFTEICRGTTIQLLNFADTVAGGSPSLRRLFQMVHVFHTLRDMIPQFQSLFSDLLVNDVVQTLRDQIPQFQSLFSNSLVNEAVAVLNRSAKATRDLFMKLDILIFDIPEAKLVAPANGGCHPMMDAFISHLVHTSRLRQILEQILQEYSKDANEAGTSLFTAKMESIMNQLARILLAKSESYKTPALRYIFMMNNHRRIENVEKMLKLGTTVGNDRIQKYRAKLYIERYQRSSWNKLLDILKLDSNESPNVAAESMKDKLNRFNLFFENLCQDQSTWFIIDKQLREEIIMSVESTLLHAYGNFIGRLHDILGRHAYEYIKYGIFDIQDRLNHLFLGSNTMN